MNPGMVMKMEGFSDPNLEPFSVQITVKGLIRLSTIPTY